MASFRLEKEQIFAAGQMMGVPSLGGKKSHTLFTRNAICIKPCDSVHCFTQSQQKIALRKILISHVIEVKTKKHGFCSFESNLIALWWIPCPDGLLEESCLTMGDSGRS